MTPTETPSAAPALLTEVREKLKKASAPLTLSAVTKGLPRPKKTKAADFQQEVRQLLEEEIRLGQAFCYPSGSKGGQRYWGKDEKEAIRTEIIRETSEPRSVSELRATAKQTIRGTDNKYIDAVIEELVKDDHLFKHQITARGYKYACRPQPVLEQPRFRGVVEAMLKSARRLQQEAGLTTEDLKALLTDRLSPPLPPPVTPELDGLILKIVAAEGGADGTVLIPALRKQMPSEYRGRAFDEAVFRLANLDKVFLVRDDRAGQLSEVELAEFVRDENQTYFGQIGLRE